MQIVSSRRSGAASLSLAALAGIALISFAVFRFPVSLQMGGLTKAFVSGSSLLMYAIAAQWISRSRFDHVQSALKRGASFGVALGATAVIGHTLEVFAAFQPPVPAILGVANWGVMFLLLGLACAETYRHTPSMALGIASSVWAGLISATTTVTFALFVGLLFMSHMQQLLAGAFVVSGMIDARAFVIRNMLDSASTHLLIAPLVAMLSGVASATASSALRSIRRRTAVALSVCVLILFISGASALRFASSLQRAARPPFVALGLLALGASLTSVGPIFASIRQGRR